jgi:predicted Zn-dependent protease
MSHRALAAIAVTILSGFIATTTNAQITLPQTNDPRAEMATMGTINAGNVSGSVKTLDGRPVSDARIEVKDLTNGSILTNTFSKTNGAFELYNIPQGSYEVVATKGVSQTHERVSVLPGMAFVSLQIAGPVSDAGNGATVSVAQYRVPGKARKEFNKAQKAFNDNKFDEAKQHAGKALEIYPTFAEALTLRGILAVNDHNTESGLADLQNAMKCDSNYALAYFAYGATMNQEQKFDDAIRTLERGVSIAPDAWQGQFEMAKAALGKGDYKRALKSVNQAEKLLDKDYPPMHLVKAHALLGVKQYDAAVAELEGYLKKEPNSSLSASARQTLNRAKAFTNATPKSSAVQSASGTQ